jgi:cyclase
MLKNRVIPCLLMQDSGLVKTRQFRSPKYVGDPINAIRIFNDKEVDELLVLDIGASRKRREPDYALIEQFAGECFMPLCYGGGITNVDQAKRLFSIGVEKVCLQTAVINNMRLVQEIADRYGRQSVVVSVDVKKSLFGKYRLYSAASDKTLKSSWLQFIANAVSNGAGEIMLNSVDRDGMMQGMDLSMIRLAAKDLPVPLIAAGGVGSLTDIRAAVDSGANAVAVGAFFVFHGPHRAVLISYPRHDQLENLLETE